MSTVLEDTEPFKLVFSYALMRDENGEEMHKSKGNAIWFEDAAERMGVDAMRWTFARHDPANNINFGFNTAEEVRRRFIIPLWNVYSFFVTYANIDQFDPNTEAPLVSERPDLDRWILSELHQLIADVTSNLERFEPDPAARRAEEFVETLSNWYVRRSRRRFWKSGLVGGDGSAEEASPDDVTDKLAAYATLYEVLVTLTKLLAPIIPFVTEEMYRNLTASLANGRESVHLEDYPEADSSLVDEGLNEVTRLAQRVSSMGRAARSKAQIKVRQPLEKVLVGTRTQQERDFLDAAMPQILDELNIRTLEVIEGESDVQEVVVQPNLPVLGPKYGPKVGEIREALGALTPEQSAKFAETDYVMEVAGVQIGGDDVLITRRDTPGVTAVSDGGFLVAISTEVTPELLLEGQARELVHRIQSMRRDAGFDIADRILTYYYGEDLSEIIAAHGEYIKQETLSTYLIRSPAPDDAHVEEMSFDSISATIALVKA